jgi:tetratricopeptide (TPR) repeat protein
MAFLKNALIVIAITGLLVGLTYWNQLEVTEPQPQASVPEHLAQWDAERYQSLRDNAGFAVTEGRWSDVVQFCNEMLEWREDDETVWFWLGCGHLIQGDYEQSERVWNYMLRFPRNRQESLYNLTCSLAMLGKSEEALGVFEQLLAEGFSDFEHADEDEHLFPLRGEPRFERMLDELSARVPFEFGNR